MKLIIHGAGILGVWAAKHATKYGFSEIFLVNKELLGESHSSSGGTFTIKGNFYPDSHKWSHCIDRESLQLWLTVNQEGNEFVHITGRCRIINDTTRKKRVIQSLPNLSLEKFDPNYVHPQFGNCLHLSEDGFIETHKWRRTALDNFKSQQSVQIVSDLTEIPHYHQKDEFTNLHCRGAFQGPGPSIDRVIGISCKVDGECPRGIFEVDDFLLRSTGKNHKVAGGMLVLGENESLDTESILNHPKFTALCQTGDNWISSLPFKLKRNGEWILGCRPKPPRLFPVWGKTDQGHFYINGLYKKGAQWAPAITKHMIKHIGGKINHENWFSQFFNKDLS